MNEAQRMRRQEIEKRYRADPECTARAFGTLLDEAARVYHVARKPLHLVTDRHRTYRYVLSKHAAWQLHSELTGATHMAVDSKRARTATNPLAAVNTLERSIRNDLAEHVRETIRFARNVNCSLERLCCYQHWHNYRKPFRTMNISPRIETHSEHAGLDPVVLGRSIRGFFRPTS